MLLKANNFAKRNFAAITAAAFATANPAAIAANQIPLGLIIAPSNSTVKPFITSPGELGNNLLFS